MVKKIELFSTLHTPSYQHIAVIVSLYCHNYWIYLEDIFIITIALLDFRNAPSKSSNIDSRSTEGDKIPSAVSGCSEAFVSRGRIANRTAPCRGLCQGEGSQGDSDSRFLPNQRNGWISSLM